MTFFLNHKLSPGFQPATFVAAIAFFLNVLSPGFQPATKAGPRRPSTHIYKIIFIPEIINYKKFICYLESAECRKAMVKKGAEIEISARINPISYEKPKYKRRNTWFYCFEYQK